MTTITPPQPPAPSAPAPNSGPGGPAPRSGARALAIVLAVIGAVIILGTISTAVLSAVASATVRSTTESVSAADVAELDIDVSAGRLEIVYADVDDATLEVQRSSAVGDWVLERNGDTLVVATPRSVFGFGWMFGGPGRGVLTLPTALETDEVDASIELSAGDLEVSGTYGVLDLNVSAGTVSVSGSARTLESDLSAGRAELELADVDEARFTVSAGSTRVEFTGSAPSSVRVDVSAGSLHATLPDETYDVNIDREAGDVDNRLDTASNASRIIEGAVSAGDVTLVPGD